MKYKILVFSNVVALSVIAAFSKYEHHLGTRRITPIDLYSKHPTSGTCCRIVNSVNTLSNKMQKGVGGIQATIQSNGGTRYTLWEDSGCATTAVYFIGC